MLQQHGNHLQQLLDVCLQVVGFATDSSNPDKVFLMEGGLDLWHEAMAISTVYTETLHVLFRNIVCLLEHDYEHVIRAMTILDRYLRLGGAQFWQTYHANIEGLLSAIVGHVKAEASIQIGETIESIVLYVPSDQLKSCVGVFQQLFQACVAYRNKDIERESEAVVVSYLSVFARLLLQHLDLVVVDVLHKDMAALLLLVDLMLQSFFRIAATEMTLPHRKLWALGLCQLLDIVEQPILERVGQIVEACSDVLTEEMRQREHSADKEAHHRSHPAKAHQVEEDAAITRVDLKAQVSAKMAALSTQLDSTLFQQVLQSIDSSVLPNFQ